MEYSTSHCTNGLLSPSTVRPWGMDSGHAAARGMTCGLAGFLLVAMLGSIVLLTTGLWDPSSVAADLGSDVVGQGTLLAGRYAPYADLGPAGASVSAPPGTDVDKMRAPSEDVGGGDLGDDGVPFDRLSPSADPWPLGLPFVFIPARTQKGRLLEHRTRRRILEEVRRHPGIHQRKLMRMLGVSNGTLAYHLRQLERAGYLRLSRAHGRKLLWAPEAEVDEQFLLMTDRELQLLALLGAVRTARTEDLGRRSGLKPSSVDYHMNRLRALGFVQAWREGHALVFSRRKDGPTSKVCTTNDSPA